MLNSLVTNTPSVPGSTASQQIIRHLRDNPYVPIAPSHHHSNHYFGMHTQLPSNCHLSSVTSSVCCFLQGLEFNLESRFQLVVQDPRALLETAMGPTMGTTMGPHYGDHYGAPLWGPLWDPTMGTTMGPHYGDHYGGPLWSNKVRYVMMQIG